jgi:hypothetical protein
LEIQKEMKEKDAENKKKKKGNSGGWLIQDEDPERGFKNFIQTCKQIHFHTKIQVGLCIKFITKKLKLADELKIGPIVIDIFQPIKQVGHLGIN